MRIFLCLFLVLSGPLVFAAEKMIATGEVFDPSGKEKKFIYEKYQAIEGDKIFDRAVYKDLKGQILVEEKMETLKGELVHYDIEHRQLKHHAWIETPAGKVIFNLQKMGKEKETAEAKKPDAFTVPLQISPLVHRRWEDLVASKAQKIQLGVWGRLESISFTLVVAEQNEDAMTIKMYPSNMLLRVLVKPLYFVFDKKTKYMTEYKGRIVPKVDSNGDLSDYDGLTKYKYLN